MTLKLTLYLILFCYRGRMAKTNLYGGIKHIMEVLELWLT